MKSFEEKREEYFNEMKSDSDFLMSVMATKDNQDQKTMEVLFTPKNDQELEIAKVLYRYISDSIRVTLRALEGAYEEDTEWNPKESPYFNLYEGLIKGLMKNGEIDKSLIDPACHYRGRESALLTYDMLTGFVSHVDEAYETLAEDCGIDFDDDFSAIQFKLYFDRIKEYIETNSEAPISNLFDKEKFSNFKSFVEEFHELCTQDKGKEQEEKGPRLSRKPNSN